MPVGDSTDQFLRAKRQAFIDEYQANKDHPETWEMNPPVKKPRKGAITKPSTASCKWGV
jgi:hypothetical protein